jgi:hypothetical protein
LGTFARVDDLMLKFTAADPREKFSFKISRTEAEKICIDEYRKMVLSDGRRHQESVSLRAVQSVAEVMYPYWVAYFQIGAPKFFAPGWHLKILRPILCKNPEFSNRG